MLGVYAGRRARRRRRGQPAPHRRPDRRRRRVSRRVDERAGARPAVRRLRTARQRGRDLRARTSWRPEPLVHVERVPVPVRGTLRSARRACSLNRRVLCVLCGDSVIAPAIVVATAVSYALGWAIGIPLLVPVFNTLAAFPFMVAALSRGDVRLAVTRMLVWALALGVCATLLSYAQPWRTDSLFLRAASYRVEMFQWVMTGHGAESDPARFIPQQAAHAAVWQRLLLRAAGWWRAETAIGRRESEFRRRAQAPPSAAKADRAARGPRCRTTRARFRGRAFHRCAAARQPSVLRSS